MIAILKKLISILKNLIYLLLGLIIKIKLGLPLHVFIVVKLLNIWVSIK
jgi:hypothetical protein